MGQSQIDAIIDEAKKTGSIVLAHYSNETLSSGDIIAVPSSFRLQSYDVETFERLSKQNVKDGKQTDNLFYTSGINYILLFDPLADVKETSKKK